MSLTPEAQHSLAVQHRIGLSRYSTAVVRKVMALLNRTEKDVIARLSLTLGETLTASRMEVLLEEVRALQVDGWKLIRQRIAGEVTGLAEVEARFALRLAGVPTESRALAALSTLPTTEQVVAAVNSRPFQGRFLREWLAGAEEGAAARTRDVIRQGFVEGRSTDQIVRTLRGTGAAGYQDGVLEITRRGAEAMVRTALTHTANTAAQTAWAANAGVVKAWRFVATLDGRTTLICAGLHGKEYALGSGPQPPRHVNCRSTSIPVLDPIPGAKPFEMPSYQEWLKRQPVEVQDDILGSLKGRLFRDGGLTVDRFTDNKGRVLSLAELRRRDVAAFTRAGL